MTLLTKTLLIIGVLLLVFALFQKNSNFFDIGRIVFNHVELFKGNLLQGVLVFVSPALIAISIALGKTITKDIVDSVVVVLSIFSALFFAELSVLCTLQNENKTDRYKQLLNETFNTVLFEILISMVVLIVAFVILFLDNYTTSVILKAFSFIIYYLTIELVLNEFILIKRIKALFLANA